MTSEDTRDDPRRANTHTPNEDDQLDFTDTQPSEEVVFNIAHQDEGGVIHFDVVRTTVRSQDVMRKKSRVKQATEVYYQAIGHSLIYIQLQVENTALVKGVRARPRLRVIKGGLLGGVLALSSVLGSGNMMVDDWLTDAEAVSEVASLERRRHPGLPRLQGMMNQDLGLLGTRRIYGWAA